MKFSLLTCVPKGLYSLVPSRSDLVSLKTKHARENFQMRTVQLKIAPRGGMFVLRRNYK